jgi:hypothetical protein
LKVLAQLHWLWLVLRGKRPAAAKAEAATAAAATAAAAAAAAPAAAPEEPQAE